MDSQSFTQTMSGCDVSQSSIHFIVRFITVTIEMLEWRYEQVTPYQTQSLLVIDMTRVLCNDYIRLQDNRSLKLITMQPLLSYGK